jgi:hypothetical protein
MRNNSGTGILPVHMNRLEAGSTTSFFLVPKLLLGNRN